MSTSTLYKLVSDTIQILYIDINNLYGWALSQYLPCGGFEWILEDSALTNALNDIYVMRDDEVLLSKFGYVFEVDLTTPPHLHDKFEQLPPAPVIQAPPNSTVNKLLLTHEAKTHYICHFSLLNNYIKLGIQVNKIHRAIKFAQKLSLLNI